MTAFAWVGITLLVALAGYMIYVLGYVTGYQDGSDRTALEFTLRLGRDR